MKKLMESMKLDYVDIFKGAGDAIKTSLEEIADAFACGHAVLFHCTAGKDRTGILACVPLDLCGVSAYDILADYQVSATYNTEGVNQRFGKELLSNPMVAKMLASNVEMMQPLLDYLHETGCEQRLLDIGVSMDTIQTIRSHMMEKI